MKYVGSTPRLLIATIVVVLAAFIPSDPVVADGGRDASSTPAKSSMVGDRPGTKEFERPPLSRFVFGLAICLATFVCGIKIYQRFTPAHLKVASRRMHVIERLGLNNRSSLVLVSIDGREYLVGAGSEPPTICQPIDRFNFMEEVCKESSERVAA